MSLNWGAVRQQVLGLVLLGAGLWFAFLHSKTFERLADGTIQTHYDHTALYVGVGVALFGMLMISPATVAEAIKDAKGILGRRLSGTTPVQKDGDG